MALDQYGNLIPSTGMLSPPPPPPPASPETNVEIGREADETIADLSGVPTATTSIYAGGGTVDQTAGERAQESAAIKSGEEFYDTDRGTVAGQLESLLSKDSPYLQQANTAAKLQAQRSGMLGSSMAAGAREGARIAKALPIATADAGAYQRLQEAEQAQYGAAGQLGAEGEVSGYLKQMGADLANEQQSFATKLNLYAKEFDYAATNLSQEMMAGVANEHELATGTALATLNASLEAGLQAQQIDAETAKNAKILAADYLKSHQITVETLMSNESFTSLGPEAITKTFNNLLAQTVGAIKFTADSSGWDATEWIDQLTSDLEWTTSIDAPEVAAGEEDPWYLQPGTTIENFFLGSGQALSGTTTEGPPEPEPEPPPLIDTNVTGVLEGTFDPAGPTEGQDPAAWWREHVRLGQLAEGTEGTPEPTPEPPPTPDVFDTNRNPLIGEFDPAGPTEGQSRSAWFGEKIRRTQLGLM